MLPVLVFTDRRYQSEYLKEALAAIDRRIRAHCLADVAALAEAVRAARPVLALVSVERADLSLRVVALLRLLEPALSIVAEIAPEHPRPGRPAGTPATMAFVRRPGARWEWQQQCRLMIDAYRYRHAVAAALRRRWRPRDPGPAGDRELRAALARADALHDPGTGAHDLRTGRYAGLVAAALGLPAERCRHIEIGASLHDIGKIGIPDEVLRKPGRFTDEDRQVMRDHPHIGYQILSGAGSAMLHQAAEIALTHHERFDGSGYPAGLAGAAIPIAGRITAVADVFDALTGARAYRRRVSAREGLGCLVQDGGRMFDPDCVEALRSRLVEVERVIDGR
jgi:HD-GYP domain-containing protein (c-di-GMP phosphodiesterase class II)